MVLRLALPRARPLQLSIRHRLTPLDPSGSPPDWHLLLVSPSSVFTSMSSALAQYESFLVAHVSTISSLESSLRSITWILPGRFKDAELASEARQ